MCSDEHWHEHFCLQKEEQITTSYSKLPFMFVHDNDACLSNEEEKTDENLRADDEHQFKFRYQILLLMALHRLHEEIVGEWQRAC